MSSQPTEADKYLLDTNVLSDLMRRPQGRIADHIRRVGEHNVCTSIIVAAELRFGAAKSGSPRLQKQVDTVLAVLETWPVSAPVEHHYADIRMALEKAGQSIGPNDMLIAAHARAFDRTVVTANVNEFKRISGLQVENWLEDPH